MEKNLMKAICSNPAGNVELLNVPRPVKAEPSHVLVKMKACGINPGDKAFIGRTFPIGIVLSHHDIYGVSGAGTVLEIGEGVPDDFKNQKVAVYRSLMPSNHIVGVWSQYAHVHFLDCAILPDIAKMEEYAGSLVNIITPYAFLKQIKSEGHRGIICTAGNSATGIAMQGICQANDFPMIAIVRTFKEREILEEFKAKHILVQEDGNFKSQLKELAENLSATAVFDGVGGSILNDIIDLVPVNTTIYAYGYLGGQTPLTIHTSALMRGITLKGFSNFRSPVVQDTNQLEKAMKDISNMLHMPQFKTNIGRMFKLEQITEALNYFSPNGGRAILLPD